MSARPTFASAPRADAGRGLLLALLALMAWAPVPLGSNRGWSAALLAAGVLGLAFALLLGSLWRGARDLDPVRRDAWPVGLLFAWAAWAFVQLLPLPLPLLALASPAAGEAWLNAGATGLGSLSLDRGATLAAAVHAASLAALLALVLATVTSRRRLWLACSVVVGLGALQALLGVGLALARARGWVASGPVEGVGGASGTFVNPNHFAGFLELALCVSVGMLLALGSGAHLPDSRRELARRVLGFALSPRVLLLSAQLVMVVGVLWSGSRGAVLALAAALATVMLGILPPSKHGGWGSRIAGVALAGTVVAAALAWGGTGSLGDKLAGVGLRTDRVALAAAVTDMVADFPLAGSGAGSFRSVFPAYKSEPLGTSFYAHAHNDFLEIAAEGGLVGAALFFGGVLTALVAALARARRRADRTVRTLTAGCAAGATSLLVHGLYDFNLQIPANAALFAMVLGLAIVASRQPRSRGPGRGVSGG